MTCLHTWIQDKWVKYWGDLHQETLEFDRSRLVGIFMPIWNRRKLAEASYTSLIRSMPPNYPFGFIALDGTSDDGTLEYFQGQVPTFGAHSPEHEFPYDIEGLLTKDNTPNVGVHMWLGRWLEEEGRFENPDRVGYICWVHCDMDFVREGWLGDLVNIYEQDPEMGILGPASSEAADWMEKKWQAEGKYEVSGNVAPFLISVEVLTECYKKYGYFLDPGFWWPVACDDWDMHQRMRELGYKSIITKRTVVVHPSGGTRVPLSDTHPDWLEADSHNRAYYVKKWDTDKHPFEVDPAGGDS